ncbi:hypothetical protein F0U62_03825 [Cystobacter fuscus]|uniref:hypothetical protein n=1 Tax=Cystobacter fuscus TaxID=43 RepID=UPI002B284800|nr:hypothetical protein F0U62_03825 [Cystobacter fuscus]
MAKSRTFYPNLSRALPADDPLAKLAARALVLYGDLLFEWPGVGSDDGFEGLAKLGDFHRRLYFFRASSVTLQSCCRLLDQLMADSSFREMRDNDADAAARFRKAMKDFYSHKEIVARIRNEVGGHMEQDIGEAITRFSPDDFAPIELHSADVLRPHLATNILFHAIVKNRPGDSEDAQRAEFVRIMNDISAATVAMINILTEFLGMYGDKYPLFGS